MLVATLRGHIEPLPERNVVISDGRERVALVVGLQAGRFELLMTKHTVNAPWLTTLRTFG